MVLDGAVSYIFIVTGNQMFIAINLWFPVTIKMFKKMGKYFLLILLASLIQYWYKHIPRVNYLVFNNLDTKRNQKFKYHILAHINLTKPCKNILKTLLTMLGENKNKMATNFGLESLLCMLIPLKHQYHASYISVLMISTGPPVQDQWNFRTSKFFCFCLELYENKLKNLIRTSKLQFWFWKLHLFFQYVNPPETRFMYFFFFPNVKSDISFYMYPWICQWSHIHQASYEKLIASHVSYLKFKS